MAEIDRLFVSGYSLHMLVEGEEQVIRDILAQYGTVRAAEMVPCGDDKSGRWQLALQVDGMDDLRKELFYSFANAHCPILEMSREAHSLEEIFLALTTEAKS